MKKIVLIFILILIIGGGAFYWSRKKKNSGKDREATQTITVETGTIETKVESTGEVAPLNRVEIKPPISGRIEQILVEEGDTVKAGQTLAWMSSNDRAAILDAARARGPEETKRWGDTYKPTPLVAPLSGTIILRDVVVGQTVDLSSILFALSDKLIVLAHVDEVDIGKITVGMPTRITLDSYPQDPIEGKVSSILYEGKNVSNVITYGVKITPLTVPRFFRSQMTANVSLLISRKENVLTIPRKAIQENGGTKVVLVPGPEGKPMSKEVETGIESGDDIEILSGLEAGDKVLISRKRYTPQKAASQSPLIMSGPKNNSSGGATAPRQRSQSQ